MAGRLRIGVIPLDDTGKGLARMHEFARAVEVALGEPVEVRPTADYGVLVTSMVQGLVDVGWLAPLVAARGFRTGHVIPVAVTVRNGTTSYMSGLFTLKASRIHTIADLRGVRAAWVDRESASGYVVIRAALRAAGVRLVDAFSDEIFVRSHGSVARALYTGQADVGATCFNYVAGTLEIARSGYTEGEGGLPHEKVRLLAQAGPIPSDILAVHRTLPSRVIDFLQAAFVDARPRAVHELAREIMHADGFVRPTNTHLSMLENLVRTIETTPGTTLPPPPR